MHDDTEQDFYTDTIPEEGLDAPAPNGPPVGDDEGEVPPVPMDTDDNAGEDDDS